MNFQSLLPSLTLNLKSLKVSFSFLQLLIAICWINPLMPVAPPGNNWFPTILLFSLKCFLCRFGLESTQPGVIPFNFNHPPFNLNLQLQYKTLQPKACQYFVSIQENHKTQNPLSRKPSLDISCSKNTLISFRVLTSTKSQSKSSSFIFF